MSFWQFLHDADIRQWVGLVVLVGVLSDCFPIIVVKHYHNTKDEPKAKP